MKFEKLQNYALHGPYSNLKRQRRLKANFNDFSLPGESLIDSSDTSLQGNDQESLIGGLNSSLQLRFNERNEATQLQQQAQHASQEPNAWEEIPVLGSALDFVGNTLWGFGESFVVPTVADIASGGNISQAFGSQDWKDESLAGKLGYALGTGLGFISGVGVIGKGLSWGTKAVSGSMKYYADDIAKGIVKSAPELVTKEAADRQASAILKTAQTAIDDGMSAQLKSTTPILNYFKRKSLRDSPLNDQMIHLNTNMILRKELGDAFGLVDDKLDDAISLVMDTAARSRSHNFGHHLTQRLMNRGFWGNNPWNKKVWGENVSTRIGNMVYEAALLSTHGVVFGEIADMTAKHMRLTDQEWNFDSVWSRAAHGAVMGGALSQVRFITGGKAVQWGNSGMINDMKQLGKALFYNFRGVRDMSGKAMQSSLNIIYDTSGKNSSIFKSIEGMGATLLNKKTLTAADEKILRNAMLHLKSQLPSTMKTLSKEIVRDGFESSRRAVTGSLVMNFEAWKHAHEEGILFTEDYGWDRMLFDTYVGWVYMKRGTAVKSMKGEPAPKFPRYYEQMGIDPKGNEIALMEKFMVAMGKKDSDLALIQTFRGMDAKDSLNERIEREKIHGNEDLAALNKEVTKDFLDAKDLQKFVEANPDSKLWSEWISDRAQIIREKMEKATGKEKESLDAEYNKLIEMKVVAEHVVAHMLVGNAGKVLKTMTEVEAMDFMRRINEYKLDGGTKPLTADTVDAQLTGLRHHSVNEVTRVIRDFTIEYLRESLNSLGLWSDANIGSDGRVQIHSSILTALDKGRNMKVAGETNLEPAFYQLVEMIRQAESSGVVRLGDYGIKFRTQDLQAIESLEKFNQTYHTYTERMHDMVFNDGTTSSNWRQIVPGWEKDKGYFDPSIMSSTAIWSAIQTQNRIARHDFTYRILTGKGGTNSEISQVFLQLRDWFGGNKKIELAAEGTETNPIPPELEAFMSRLNYIHALVNPEASEGVRTVSVKELTNIMEKVSDPSKGIGNIFVDSEEFHYFKEYVYDRYIQDVTGNPNLGAGLKRVIARMLELENPLTLRRRGGLELVTTRTLRELLLEGKTGVDKLNTSEQHTLELIDAYEKHIELPLRNELMRQNSLISFSDQIKPTLEFIDRSEIKQVMQEMLNEVSKISHHEFTSLITDVSRMGGELEKMMNKAGDLEVEALQTGNTKAVEKIKEGIGEIAKTQGQLESLIANYIANRDMVGLRALINSRSGFLNTIREMSVDPLTESKSLIEYKRSLDKYLTDAIRTRNENLDIADVKGINDYITDQLSDIELTDRNGQIKTHHHSISDNQYASRWHKGDATFLETIKTKPIDLLNAVENLNTKAMSIITEYQKSPDILDPNSSTYIGVERYVSDVVKPILESQKSRIENMKDLDPNLGKTGAERYEQFVLDTYQVLVSGMASKKVAIGIFENGTLHISEGKISNADRGINKLSRKLGIGHLDGSIILAGGRLGTEHGFTTRLTRGVLDALQARMSKGTFIDISAKELMSREDKLLLESFEGKLVGDGQGGSSKYLPIMIDGKTMIFVHKSAGKQITRHWADPKSEVRQELLNIFEGNPKAEAIVSEYLTKQFNGKVNDSGYLAVENNATNIKKLVMLTRMMNVAPDAVKDMILKKLSPIDALSDLKYETMDSPRSGIELNDRTLLFTQKYLETMIPKSEKLGNAIEIFNKQMFDKNGKVTKHRKVVINDESGQHASFFNTQGAGVKELTKQFMESYGMDKAAAKERAEELMDIYKPIAASSVNGETYLSLPEMTAQLMAKGGNPEWFIKNAAGEIVGFNVVIKPIENLVEQNLQTGEITVFQGKTAYKYHPKLDAAMKNVNGEYIIDSISFESTAKKNLRKRSGSTEFESRNHNLKEKYTDGEGTFIDRLVGGLKESPYRMDIVELPRSAIFLKSISGPHDATMSSGYTNFISNDALRSIQSITKSNDNVKDMMNRYSHMWENPFTYLKIAQQLRSMHAEDGNMTSRLIGIEGILEAGGLPVFEFMGPQIERMMNSEYLGKRDFSSSTLTDGSYNVMTGGSDLSLPVRAGGRYGEKFGAEGTQISFGGSGIPYTQYNKPISKLILASRSGTVGEGGQGINLIFTLDKAVIKQFKMESLVGVGHDVIVTHDGLVLGPHQRTFSFSEKAKIAEFEAYLKEQYQFVLKGATNNAVQTLGELAMFIDGKTLDKKTGHMTDIKLDNLSPEALSNQISIGTLVKENAFKGIHIGVIDLRTPKAGLNDWVITRLEKLLDRRRGPVSEMNKLDVLDPQDADFDLDKSSSIHAMPGKVVQEMYNVSGIIDPASRIFDRVIDEIRLENPTLREDYYLRLKQLESKRPLLVRQHSIASFLLQSFAAQQPGYNLWGPKNKVFDSGNGNFALSEMIINNRGWRISFKGDNNLKDSIGHLKSLIKETIDIYKRTGNIDERSLTDLVWNDAKRGMLTIEQQVKGKWESVDWKSLNTIPVEVIGMRQTIIKDILTPLGSLFDMANMTESYMDGTSRKMSLYDMVSRFQNVKNSIRWAGLTYQGYDKKGNYIEAKQNALYGLTEQILSFLGTKPKGAGISEHPLVKGLLTMERGLRKHFKDQPGHDTTLGSLLAGVAGRSEADISIAISKIVKDQSKWAQLSYTTWELNQIEDGLSMMRAMGKRNTSRYSALEAQYQFKVKVLNEFNKAINNPANIDPSEVKMLKPGKNRFVPREWGKVGHYREIDGKMQLINVLDGVKGDRADFVQKGDQFVINYKVLRLGNENVNTQRRAMSRAFAVEMPGLSRSDIAVIDGITSRFRVKLRTSSGILDKNSPNTSDKYGLISEAQTQVVIDHLLEAMGSSPTNGNQYALQFLFNMLSPKASRGTYDVLEYDPASKQSRKLPHFNSNKLNERLVFNVLDRLRSDKGSQVIDHGIAEQWYQEIIKRHKTAFLREWDPTLQGEAFDTYLGTARQNNDFSIMSRPDVLPRWVSEVNLNRQAHDIMLSYLDGRYFLDPIELYRLSAGLGNTSMGKMPDAHTIGDRVRSLWQGGEGYRIDPQGLWYLPKKTYRRSLLENPDTQRRRNAKEELQREYESLCP